MCGGADTGKSPSSESSQAVLGGGDSVIWQGDGCVVARELVKNLLATIPGVPKREQARRRERGPEQTRAV